MGLQPEIIPPQGYHIIYDGETVPRSDLVWVPDTGEWIGPLHAPMAVSIYYAVARKDPSEQSLSPIRNRV